MKQSRIDLLAGWLVTGTQWLALAILIAPIAVTLVLSFSTSLIFPPDGLTLSWYEAFLARRQFVDGLKVSLLLAGGTVLASTSIGTGLALVLVRRRFPGRALLNTVVLSPLTLPRVAGGVAIFLFFVAVGVRVALFRLLVMHVIIAVPFVLSVVGASLAGLDTSLEEAAMNLGASRLETFRRITLPLIRPGIFAGAIISFVVSFDEVTASMFLVDARTTTFPVVLFSYMYRGGVDPTVAAASSIMLLLLVVVMVLLDRSIGLGRALGIWRGQ